MSDLSDIATSDTSEKADDKDEDFNIEDYRHEIDSDDSFEDIHEDIENNDRVDNETEAKQQNNESVGPILPGGHRFDKKFICVKYPGNVINPDKAIETLGGICAISKAVDTPNRRLELRFRPDDIYGKPACGDRHTTAAFLLRVRVKKSRAKKVDEASLKSTTVNITPEDIVNVNTIANISNKAEQQNVRTNSNRNLQSDGSGLERADIHSNANDTITNESSMTELVKQIQNCNVGSKSDSAYCSKKNLQSAECSKSSYDTLQGNNTNLTAQKKNVKPTFDRNKYEDLSQDTDYEIPKVKVLGRVDTEFKFTNLCDFQYLPLTESKTDPRVLEYVYDKVCPSGIPPYSWLKNEVPYFLPPAAFSRMDSVQQYIPKTERDSLPQNVISKNRKRRVGFANYIYFTTPGVPATAPQGIATAMKVKFLQSAHIEQVRQLFEKRPIWSKNAIMYKTNFTSDQLKILLPSVAYYFMSGPWRIMWVRLGYDPRKEISARKYQTLDYRLKAMCGLGSTVKCKRNYGEYTLPYKSASVSKQKAAILTPTVNLDQSQKKERQLSENVYIYRDGLVPPSRQMFYQYCDIHVDEIQEMLAKLPDPLPGTKCHEKRGWLPSGFDVQCREIINKQIRAVLRKRMNIPADHPTSLPRKRKLKGTSKLKNRYRNKKSKKEFVKVPLDEPLEESLDELLEDSPVMAEFFANSPELSETNDCESEDASTSNMKDD